jgi:hypothetical protein
MSPVLAQTSTPTLSHAVVNKQSTDVLIWQGRILPIVTDAFASISNLGAAIQKSDAAGVSKAGDEFAGELIRFQLVKPIPQAVQQVSRVFMKSLKDMSAGSKSLADGLRGTISPADAQRAANQLLSGLHEFQQAVDQIRRNSGPIGEPTVAPLAHSGPTPTPIIRGLP